MGCMTKHRATRHLGFWPQYQVALYRLFKVVLSVSAIGNLLLIVCYVFFMQLLTSFYHYIYLTYHVFASHYSHDSLYRYGNY